MIQVYTEVSVSVCSTNIVFYINFSVTVGIQSQNLERILQKKLNWCDPKRKRGTVTMWGQKEKWQITSRAHSEPYLNTWAGIYPRFHTFAYPLVNSHIILNVFTSAKASECSLQSALPFHSPPVFSSSSHHRVEISVIGPVSKGSRVSQASAEPGHWNFPRQVTPTNGIWVPQRLSVCEM